MDLDKIKRRASFAWAAVSLLVVLCGVLGVLQYRWIGEVADAERARLRADLQARLNLVRRNFNEQISTVCAELRPSPGSIESLGRDEAYLERYRRLENPQARMVNRIALAVPEDGDMILLLPDGEKNEFARAPWPAEWSGVRERLVARTSGEPVGPDQVSTVIETPRFGPARDAAGNPTRARELEWLLVDLNTGYLRDTLLPEILNRHLSGAGRLDYDAKVVTTGSPSHTIFRSNPDRDPETPFTADASVTLLEVASGPFPGPRRGPGGPPPGEYGRNSQSSTLRPSPPDTGHGVWLLMVHNRAGSLEALVAQARWRNVALSGAILLVILAMIASLVLYCRQAQHVAELQMNFVAGVSHELRTPLTVIRTAAYNLRGKLASRPDQVERYGKLIQDETEKLAALVEQVLRYGSAQAGRVIQEREPLAVEEVIDRCLVSHRNTAEREGWTLEKQIEADLPLVLADEVALKHALQNLVDNAIKYGTESSGLPDAAGGKWIGVSALSVLDENGQAVEIRVADRGPGIPQRELEHIFDPFFRGRRAVEDQVHGTGLGLNLVKKIVEAHGGSIQVRSELLKGTEFTIRIPAAPLEMQNEFAHSAG